MELQPNFSEVIHLIKNAHYKAYKAVNTELINLYWEIGKYIVERTQAEGWGKSTVTQLATFIQSQEPNSSGFSDKNLWRMKQFYEAYCDFPKLSTLLRVLSWSHNLVIFSRCKRNEEREFYLRLSIKENYTVRELDRQINASVFERTMLSTTATKIEELVPKIGQHFKDQYVFEFLNLPDTHSEDDLQKSLIHQMKSFLLELGKDFLFMGQEYRLQVGNSDFYIDLLFYHRSLQCLVAFELKADKFKPEHLGQLNFYLEALDRDVKNVNENPSIGILLCKDKDDEVVEYALSRQLSPTLVSQYELALPDKKLLQAKLHEVFEQWNDKMNQEI